MKQLQAEAAQLGLQLDDGQVVAFERYGALLQTWNRRINLTSVDDEEGIRTRHFLDSLSCATVTGNLDSQRLIDVGAGAGFPGLPLKILYPGMQLTLLESVTKKVRFLQAVTDALALTAVQIVDARAETVGQNSAFREQYDWAVARAVAPLDVLLEYLLPLCRVGGRVLAMKSDRAHKEVEGAASAIETLGGAVPEVHPIRLPQRDDPSYLVVVQKSAPTPSRFPRRAGIPSKRPL